MECAGNGRALARSRARSAALAERSGRDGPLARRAARAVLEEAGSTEDAVEIVFTGLDRGIEGGESSSLPAQPDPAEALRDVLLAYEMNGSRCRHSTASRSACSSRAGTA